VGISGSGAGASAKRFPSCSFCFSSSVTGTRIRHLWGVRFTCSSVWILSSLSPTPCHPGNGAPFFGRRSSSFFSPFSSAASSAAGSVLSAPSWMESGRDSSRGGRCSRTASRLVGDGSSTSSWWHSSSRRSSGLTGSAFSIPSLCFSAHSPWLSIRPPHIQASAFSIWHLLWRRGHGLTLWTGSTAQSKEQSYRHGLSPTTCCFLPVPCSLPCSCWNSWNVGSGARISALWAPFWGSWPGGGDSSGHPPRPARTVVTAAVCARWIRLRQKMGGRMCGSVSSA
jgi:hypothetical protein